MKNKWGFLVLFLLVLSIVSGVLMSQMSLVGQLGVSTFYTEYAFLKDWYLGASVIFFSLILLSLILWLCKRFMVGKNFVILNLILVVLGLIGFFYTYYDFTSTAHKYLNSKFHTGAYLFWAGWLFVNLFFFFVRVKPKPVPVVKQEIPVEPTPAPIPPPIDEPKIKDMPNDSSIENHSNEPNTPHRPTNHF